MGGMCYITSEKELQDSLIFKCVGCNNSVSIPEIGSRFVLTYFKDIFKVVEFPNSWSMFSDPH